jgi:glyoxalase family protein
MVHRVVWSVGSTEAIDFWEKWLAEHRVEPERDGDVLIFADPEGLAHELTVSTANPPLIAEHPDIPSELALHGFEGVRAYSRDPERSRRVLEDVMSARPAGDGTWELRGDRRGGWIRYEDPPGETPIPGAGTVHHVAWATTVEEHPTWVERLRSNGVQSTPVIDRHYFHSIYFREPSGVLFEIADDGPGFTVDDPIEELGTRIILPPQFEQQRAAIESMLTPLPDPRASRTAS